MNVEQWLAAQDLAAELNAAHPGGHYDKAGNEIGLGTWMLLFEDQEYRRVGFDRVGEVEVSTVWLGLDHYEGAPAPLIFETMIFHHREGHEQHRYPSEEDARAGHERIVSELRLLQAAT